MLRVDYTKRMGEITFKEFGQEAETFGIYKCNALAAVVTDPYEDKDGELVRTLVAFFSDKLHLERCLGLKKSCAGTCNVFQHYEQITLKINTAYPEAITLLKAFTKAKYSVTAYYTEE